MSLVSRSALLIAVLITSCATGAYGQAKGDIDALKRENVQLRRRVEGLEADLVEIKALLKQMGKTLPAQPAPAPAAKPQLTPEEVKKLRSMVQGESPAKKFSDKEIDRLHAFASSVKKPVLSNLELELYGYIKLDTAYDSSRTSVGNFARWVDSEATRRNDNEFSMTAKQTRLGVKIKGPKTAGAQTAGRVEIDFYNNGGGENKPSPMLRHAYLTMDWPEHRFQILAGQTSDVHSPLFTPTVNYTVAWWQGNIGYRRPQIRLTKGFALSHDTLLKVEVAAARVVASRTTFFTPAGGDIGEDTGWPVMEGRVSLAFPFLGEKPTTIGFSGHWGEEEQDRTARGEGRHFTSWSANVDVKVPVNKWLLLQAEGFVGQNLDAYLGGIAQGFNTTRQKIIGAQGGWVAATLGPWDKWKFNIGAAADDAYDGDLSDGMRSFNRVAFGNAIYSINSATSIGLELSQLHTHYKNIRDADSLRAQLAFMYKF